MKRIKKYISIIILVLCMSLSFPIMCFAGTLEFRKIGIEAVIPMRGYLYVTQDSYVNNELWILDKLGLTLNYVQQYMKDYDLELLIYPDNLKCEIAVRPFEWDGYAGYTKIKEIKSLDRAKEIFESLYIGSAYTVNVYDSEVEDISNHTWLKGYYHIKGDGIDSNCLEFITYNGKTGFSIRIVDYADQTINELQESMDDLIHNIIFTQEYLEEIKEAIPSPTPTPTPTPTVTPTESPKTIGMIDDADGVKSATETDDFTQFSIYGKDYGLRYFVIWFVLSLLLSFVLLCLPFIIYRYAIKKRPISQKKAQKIIIIYMACYFVLSIAILFLTEILVPNAQISEADYKSAFSLLPLLIWGAIGIKILTAKSRKYKRAAGLIKKFDSMTFEAYNGKTVMDLNDRIRMLGFLACEASMLIEGSKKDYALSGDLIDAVREHMLIKSDDKDLVIINSYLKAINNDIRSIALSQDTSKKTWFEDMLYEQAGVICRYVDVDISGDNIRRIKKTLDNVCNVIESDVKRVEFSKTSQRYSNEDRTTTGRFKKESYDEQEQHMKNESSYINEDQYLEAFTISQEHIEQIKKWKDLYDAGVITEAEFIKKKKDILHIDSDKSAKMSTCPDCGKQVSLQSKSCPNCGRPLKNKAKLKIKLPNKKIMIVLSAIMAIICITLFIVKPWEKNRWIARADKSVLFIACFDGNDELLCTGSGFLLFDDRTVVTNYHVIDGVSSIEVYTADNYSYNVKGIINYDKEYDIAILQLEEHTNLRPLTIGDSSSVKKGDEVVAIGSPEGYQNSVSTGVLSGRVETILQFTAPISHGSSGGALFDSKGKVIGITFAFDESGQALNFAIPIEEVISLYYSPRNIRQDGNINDKIKNFEEVIYVSVLKKVVIDGYEDQINAEVKYYPTKDDYIREKNSGYAYMQMPRSGYTGDNFELQGASLTYIDGLDLPILTYDEIRLL